MQSTRPFPKEKVLESGLNVLKEGYMYAPNRHRAYKADAFETRLLGKKAIVIGGEEAAVFNNSMTRNTAIENSYSCAYYLKTE